MALSEIKNSTGTYLNRYQLTHEDGTSEVVTLEFYPGDDYVPGTPFNESTVNPWIQKINSHDIEPILNLTAPRSSFVNSTDYPQYAYHADIAVAGLLESDLCDLVFSPATDAEGCIEKGKTLNGVLRLYANKLPDVSVVIDSLLINRRG